ncbi:FUSC family protein [Paenirhodobacter sp.]|uniref:FUSC family protein n=1 Tax=Paenirhodobacter sp. TaxID=1965326 RepID=UPI003B3EADCA
MAGSVLRGRWLRLRDRAVAASGDALATAVAVAIAWALARWLAGHERPMFAVVTCVICLAPGLANHGRQALAMLMGVFTGIAVGELSLLVPIGHDYAPAVLRLSVVTFLAITGGALWGQGPVTAIQSGVSALMVLTMGPVAAGPERLIDVGIGTAVGLMFSQILMTPDPERSLEKSARSLLAELAQGMALAARAVEAANLRDARAAAHRLSAARGQLVALDGGIALARDNARWSLRGWRAGPRLAVMADRYDRHAVRIYAQAMILGDELYHALRDEPGRAPPDMVRLLDHVAQCLADPDHAPRIDRAAAARMIAELDPGAVHWHAVGQQAVALITAGRELLALPAQNH